MDKKRTFNHRNRHNHRRMDNGKACRDNSMDSSMDSQSIPSVYSPMLHQMVPKGTLSQTIQSKAKTTKMEKIIFSFKIFQIENKRLTRFFRECIFCFICLGSITIRSVWLE